MKFTHDPNKQIKNIEKHGVSLTDAEHLDWDSLQAKPDTRQNYGELRMIGYALWDERLYCVVFTDRGVSRHIISLRKANNREQVNYASND